MEPIMYASARPVSVSAPARPAEIAEIVAAATLALRDTATVDLTFPLEDVARWCAEVGGVDPRLERAALLHGLALISMEAVIDDVAASLHDRLIAAGPLLPALVACNGVPWVLASLGLDEVEPPADAVNRPVPRRIARFYWRRLRAYLAWSASAVLS
jgi:hypothetical protein